MLEKWFNYKLIDPNNRSYLGRNPVQLRIVAIGASLTLLLSLLVITVYAQSDQTQIWTDTENNVKILFTPKNPVVDKPTVLHLSVFSGGGKRVSSQNFLTGKYLKNLTATVVIITNSSCQERTFKFNHLHTTNGTLQNIFFPIRAFIRSSRG